MFSLSQKYMAEWLGTLLLLATVVGSGIMAENLAGGNIALALLANSLATGAILYVLIACLGAISGAHFNPAVTLGFFWRKEISARDSAVYILMQIIGGLLGVWLAHYMFELPIFQLSDTERSGPAQYMSETISTFGLCFVIFAGVTFRPKAVPMIVGLYITAAYWFTSSTSFANPAVTIARANSDTFAGIRPADAPGFILAQIMGALLAVWLGRWLLSPTQKAA